MIWFYITINLIIIFSASWMIWKKSDPLLKNFFWPAWSFKMMSGIGIGLLYYFYYVPSDTVTYHDDGEIIANFARHDFATYLKFMWHGDESFQLWSQISSIQPRAVFFVKIVSLVSLLTYDNYWISSLYFSLLSFWACWKLSSLLIRELPTLRYQIAASFLLLPSFVFWSSGMIKESVAVAVLFFLSSLLIKAWFYRSVRIWEWIIFPVALLTLWNLKYYYLALFAPLACSLVGTRLLFQKLNRPYPMIVKCFAWAFMLTTPLILVTLIHPNFYPEVFFEVIVSNYETFIVSSAPEDVIRFHSLEPNLLSIMQNSPLAAFSGLFRPLLWESHNILQVCNAIENTAILILSLAAATKLKDMLGTPHRLLLVTMLLYCLGLSVFLAMSTPNFGSLSRYRVGFMPFYFLLITMHNPIVARVIRLIQRN